LCIRTDNGSSNNLPVILQTDLIMLSIGGQGT